MENSAKRRHKEVKWGTSASSNAQFLLRSVCVGNREDGRFFGKNHMYLLTEWEGRTGKYLARGQDVRTERSEVRTS